MKWSLDQPIKNPGGRQRGECGEHQQSPAKHRVIRHPLHQMNELTAKGDVNQVQGVGNGPEEQQGPRSDRRKQADGQRGSQSRA